MTISRPLIIVLVVMCACGVAFAFFVLYWYYRLRKRRWQQVSAGVLHVFAFQWKPGSTEVQKERARKDILAFHGIIPGLLQTHVGPNISPRGKSYTFGGIM